MKKILLPVLVVFCASLYCGKGNAISEYKGLIKEMTSLTETLVSSMDKAKTGKEASDAIAAYTENMMKLKKKGEDLDKKYPEMKAKSEPPAELREEMTKFNELIQKMTASLLKLTQKFATDKDFQNAIQKLGRM